MAAVRLQARLGSQVSGGARVLDTLLSCRPAAVASGGYGLVCLVRCAEWVPDLSRGRHDVGNGNLEVRGDGPRAPEERAGL